MANKDLQSEPHHIGDHVWWYEEPNGISVLIQPSENGVWKEAVQTFIPWRAIRRALARKDAPP